MTEGISLKRSINLPLLIFYGMGTIIGGGFYALLGKVAGVAGMHTPLAFLGSGLLAGLSALSFAELSSRFPVSAGEAHYVQEGLRHRGLAGLVGWLVILTGIVSAATLSVATIGFLGDLVPVPHALGILLLVAGMGLVAAWGVGESVWMVTVITVIEVGALLYVAGVCAPNLGRMEGDWSQMMSGLGEGGVWVGILSGTFLAFYAFIGFEDMVNMAEEVKEVRRTLPVAILVCVVLSTLLYAVVSFLAVISVAPSQLATSSTPMAELVGTQGWAASKGIVVVSLLTGINGALVQIVMAARVGYGMASKGQAPAWMGRIHPLRRTPVLATVAMTGIILVLALLVALETLARITSLIMLANFALVNLALFCLKKRDPDPEGEGPRIPRWVPMASFLACLAALAIQAFWLLTGNS